MCTVPLPPGVNPIVVDNISISIYCHVVYYRSCNAEETYILHPYSYKIRPV